MSASAVQAEGNSNAPELAAVDCWLSSERLAEIYTAAYWNDIEEEKKKEWWVGDGDYAVCRRYLEETKFLLEHELAQSYIQDMPGDALQVADLAAGIGWTSALMSKLDKVAAVHAVDISRHRLEQLLPHSVVMLGGHADKIRRHLGSFYELGFSAHSMDVVYLSHAFHHAEQPLRLLMECDRILRPGGRMIVAGEHQIGVVTILRRFLSVLVRQRKLLTDFRSLFPPDPVLGDHYYMPSDYTLLFGSLGYTLRQRIAATGNAIYVADKGVRV